MSDHQADALARAAILAGVELESFDRRWDGATFRSKAHERRRLVVALEDARTALARHLASRQPPEPDTGPTAYALETIPRIAETYRATPRPSRQRVAELVGVDPDTMREWIRRGWMTWPPG